MVLRAVLLFVLISVLGSAPDAAAGRWFDLGDARFETVAAEQDPACHETFPPNAFGAFPRGSWVWQEMTEVPCDQLRWPDQVCPGGATIRAFRIEFNDGGCGCGGFVAIASTLRLTYDPLALLERGVDETKLRLVTNYNPPSSIYNIPGSRAWTPVAGAFPDVVNHRFEIPVSGDILGVREYAIVTDVFVPVEPVTWSRIKALRVD